MNMEMEQLLFAISRKKINNMKSVREAIDYQSRGCTTIEEIVEKMWGDNSITGIIDSYKLQQYAFRYRDDVYNDFANNLEWDLDGMMVTEKSD